MLKCYWDIGQTISIQQKTGGWGSKTTEKIANDLQKEFPGLEGFSRSNIFRMQAFFEAYQKVAQAARQLDDLPVFNIPWFHNVVLIQKIKNVEERLWYAEKTIENGWSRTMLTMWIESDLHKRQGKSITNFHATLPKPGSDLAQQSLKDPYLFGFLTMSDDANELDIEKGLVSHIQEFLIELGQGFAFVGRQFHLNVGDDDFYIDLLFYHLKLRCFIVVELKNTKFIPEYAGKLNFYLSVVDDKLRAPGDQPTIGLLLCKSKNNYLAEYALRDINKPIGISNYTTKLVESLPKELKGKLPSIEEIEAELGKVKVIKKSVNPVKKKAAKPTKKRAVKKA